MSTDDNVISDYYVYAHKDAQGQIFYIGKGRGGRAYERGLRRPAWHARVDALGGQFQVEFLITQLIERDALYEEADWIRRLGKLSDGTGPLVNWTDGGENELGNIGISIEVPGLKEAYEKTDVLQIRGAERVQFAEQVIRTADDSLRSVEAIYRGRRSRMPGSETLRSIISGLSEEAEDYLKRKVSTRDLAFKMDGVIVELEWLDGSDFGNPDGLRAAKEILAKILLLRERIGKRRPPTAPLTNDDLDKLDAALVALKELRKRESAKA